MAPSALPETATSLPSNGFGVSKSAFQQNHSISIIDSALNLPRIVCLHGGGTNARIFRAQCRVLRAHLAPYCRLVFPNAPFLSGPGPDVESVYAEWGPFRSWLPPGPGRGSPFTTAAIDAVNQATAESIDTCIATALREDEEAGGTGPCIGLLGFSQGAKMAASLLWRRQQQAQQSGRVNGWAYELDQDDNYEGLGQTSRGSYENIGYSFAILMAGRGPLVSLGPEMKTPGLLQLPTVHIHGLQDAGISMHRELLNRYCQKRNTRLLEWDGAHRIPIKSKDVAAVVVEILQIARATGVLAI